MHDSLLNKVFFRLSAFRDMQSDWGCICSKRLFLTFDNWASISINTRTFVKTNTNRKKYGNYFEQIFHLLQQR